MSQKRQVILITVVVVASLTLSLAILANRNLYEDELSSFKYITMSYADLWQAANSADVHPPGMYLMSKIAYSVTGSERWASIAPLLIFYLALIIFVVSVARRLSDKAPPLILFLLLSLLHPQILMWANTIRWYPYWAAFGLTALLLGLRVNSNHATSDGSHCPGRVTCIALGVLIGLMFYVSYLTLLFAVAFSVAWVIRYSVCRSSVWRLAVIMVVSVFVAAAQVIPLIQIHAKHADGQSFSVLVSFARMAHGLLISEAMLPWSPIAAIFFLGVVLPLVAVLLHILFQAFRSSYTRSIDADRRTWLALTGFLAVMLVLGTILGLGGKARSFLILAPIVAALLALALSVLKNRAFQFLAVCLSIIWVAYGASNLIMKNGLAKASMTDDREAVVALVESRSGPGGCVIFCYDAGLTYSLNAAKGDRNWHVCSALPDYVHGIPEAHIPSGFSPEQVFVIRSYTGSLSDQREQLESAFVAAVSSIGDHKTVKLSPDRDVSIKRLIPGVKSMTRLMPEYRFEVVYGEAKDGVNWSTLATCFDLSDYIQYTSESTQATALVTLDSGCFRNRAKNDDSITEH